MQIHLYIFTALSFQNSLSRPNPLSCPVPAQAQASTSAQLPHHSNPYLQLHQQQHNPLLGPPPQAVPAPQSTVAASGIGIADLAQHRRSLADPHNLFNLMRKPSTPSQPSALNNNNNSAEGLEQLHAMTAITAASAMASGINGVFHQENPQTSAQTSEEKSSRPGSSNGLKRPASDQSGPQQKIIKMENPADIYRYVILGVLLVFRPFSREYY